MRYRIPLRDGWLASLLLDKSQQRLDIKAGLLFEREAAATEVAAVAVAATVAATVAAAAVAVVAAAAATVAAAAEGGCEALGRGASGGMDG
jgi:hypothetical protein